MIKKIAILLISLVLASVCLCACVYIPDENGDEDYSLCKLTENDIINSTDYQYTSINSKREANGTYVYSIQSLSGVYTLKKVEGSYGVLTFNATITLHSGNLRACLVKDGEIVREIPINEFAQINVSNPDGKYAIKLAGESASFDVEINK